ncbi:MAG: hypothetical protein WC391_09695 [Methanoregula sp.]|jgi:hypothetical protein
MVIFFSAIKSRRLIAGRASGVNEYCRLHYLTVIIRLPQAPEKKASPSLSTSSWPLLLTGIFLTGNYCPPFWLYQLLLSQIHLPSRISKKVKAVAMAETSCLAPDDMVLIYNGLIF